MRVLLVSSNSSGSGGGERYLVYLAHGFKELGHEVVALLGHCQYMDVWAEQLGWAGAHVERRYAVALRDRRLRFLSALIDVGQQCRVAAIVRSLNPDIVHINQQYDEDGLDLVLAARRTRMPVVGTIHLPMCKGKRQRPFGIWRSRAIAAFYRRCTYAKIFCSDQAREEFAKFYGLKNCCWTVPNATWLGRRADECTTPVRVPGWSASDRVIACVGRLEHQKDPLLLLEAWALLRKHAPGTRLLFVGDGTLRARVLARAAEMGATADVHITGWLPDPSPWWKAFEVFALTSHFEGMPLALIEAVCAGKRLVAVPCSGVQEVLAHAPWAESVADRDPRSIAAALLRAIHAPLPRWEWVEGARQYFSVRRMAAETLAVYQAARCSARGATS